MWSCLQEQEQPTTALGLRMRDRAQIYMRILWQKDEAEIFLRTSCSDGSP